MGIESGEKSTEFDPELRSVVESNCAADGGISYGCGASRKNPLGKDNCCPGLVCHGIYFWRCVKEENKFCAGPTTFAKQCGSRWRHAVAHCCDGLVCGDKGYKRRCVKPPTEEPTQSPTDAPTEAPLFVAEKGFCKESDGSHERSSANRIILGYVNTDDKCLALCTNKFRESSNTANISGCQRDRGNGRCTMYNSAAYIA